MVGHRPVDYQPSKWVADDPNIVFEVPAELDNLVWYTSVNGVLHVDEKVYDLHIGFHRFGQVAVYQVDSEGRVKECFLAQGRYYENKFIMKVTKENENDTLFAGKYKKIVFTRVE